MQDDLFENRVAHSLPSILGADRGCGDMLLVVCLYLFVSGTFPEPGKNRTMGLLTFWQIVVSSITPIAILIGGLIAYKQFKSLRVSRDIDFVRTILKEYIDEPRRFKISARLMKYMKPIDGLLERQEKRYLEPEYLEQYDLAFETVCEEKLTRYDLVYFVNSLNHVSLFIDEKMAASDKHDFYPFIIRNWHRLENFVAFEHTRRDDHWWAGHFIRLAIHMESADYRERLCLRGREPIVREGEYIHKTCQCMQQVRNQEEIEER